MVVERSINVPLLPHFCCDKMTKNNGRKCIESEAENCALLLATIGITMGIRKKGATADNWLVRLHSVKTRGQSAARNLTPFEFMKIEVECWNNSSYTYIFVARILFYSSFSISPVKDERKLHFSNILFIEYIIYYLLR